MYDTIAIVVTRNRLEMLKENIDSLLKQTHSCDILLVDNYSTDGTEEYIRKLENPRIRYYNTGENLGGAGGFSYGVKQAGLLGYQFYWLMDDDSIPNYDALESVHRKIKMIDYNFSFIASLVYWTDGKLFDMNVPDACYNFTQRLSELNIISKYELISVSWSSFVGCFINGKVARKTYLPIADFFIYGDDMEYTSRLARIFPAYLDYNSVIVHKAPSNIGADVVTASEDRIKRFWYQSRNGMYIARQQGTYAVYKRFCTVLKRLWYVITKADNNKFERIKVLIYGTISGLFYKPQIEYYKEL